MAANCAATAGAGKSRASLHGCATSAALSPDGNITSRISSASSTLPASTCCSGIYEASSRTLGVHFVPTSKITLTPGGTASVHNSYLYL